MTQQDHQPSRDVPGALHGSRFISLPHVRSEVERCLAFIAGDAPVLVEIGFDHGRRLQSTALHNPDWRVLGLEVRARRVEEARQRQARDGLTNIFAWRMDARTVFAGVLPPASVDVVEILFPTPWWHPGLRRKRLLIDDPFVADVARTLRPGGLLHVATDVGAYAGTIDACLAARDELVALDLEEGFRLRPVCSQQSRREWKCERDEMPYVRRFFLRDG